MRARVFRRWVPRIRHYAVAAGVTVGALFALWGRLHTREMPATQLASIVLAYSSLGAILATLTVGPLRVLRRRPNPVSNDLRRDLGIWATLTGTAHVGLSLTHHFGGDVARYFFSEGRIAVDAIRRDGFGAGTWSGALATIVLLMLGGISNDRSMRWLGARWKKAQRFNYALVIVAVVHTAIFWVLLSRAPVVWGLAVAGMGAVGAAQVAGFTARRSRGR